MKNKCLGILFLLALSVGTANAAVITFTHSGTGSGSIGATVFSDAAFTITATGDTDDRVPIAFDEGYSINHSYAQIDIVGVGVFTFVTQTRTWVNNVLIRVGFGTPSTDLFSGPGDSAFGAWDMLSSIGPIAGSANLLQWGLIPISTSGGTLVFDSGASPSSMFQATVGVAEPGTLALLGLGLVGIGLRRRAAKVS